VFTRPSPRAVWSIERNSAASNSAISGIMAALDLFIKQLCVVDTIEFSIVPAFTGAADHQ
jgi:hypothetical protein